MTKPSCSTSADHPPAVAHVRVFTELGPGEPRAIDNLCSPCVRAQLIAHSSLLAGGTIASIVVIALAAIAPEIEATLVKTPDFSSVTVTAEELGR